jgi:hypothetical protein
MRDKQFRKSRLGVKDPDDFRLGYPHHDTGCQCGRGRQTPRLRGQATLAKKISDSHKRHHSLLALLGKDADFGFTFLHVKDGIAEVALREDNLILPEIADGHTPTYL